MTKWLIPALIWVVCYFLMLKSCEFLTVINLDLPGEECDEEYRECYPKEGYHFEKTDAGDNTPIHDYASCKTRKDDMLTAFVWKQLTTQQQQQIIDGKEKIEDYYEPSGSLLLICKD